MLKILMALLATVLMAAPAANASEDFTLPSNPETATEDTQNAVSKIWDALGLCFNPTPAASPQPSKDAAATPQPSKDVATAKPTSSSGTTAKPQPSQATTPQPSKGATAKPQPSPSSDPVNPDNRSYEEQVASLVNKERAANGLAPLSLNAKLSNVARAKSQDMHDKRYFSHTSPTYGSPFDMLRTFNITYRAAGENIAMGYSTPKAVVDGWMNSPGHRANILNTAYTQIGVGYVSSGNYWTQLFIG